MPQPLPQLSWKQVVAWRLKRGGLSRRASRGRLDEIVRQMCGAHAQIMSTVGLALNARISRLKQAHLDTALVDDHSLVKTWAMRGTLHVFAAEDIPLYCAAQATRDQYMNPSFLKFYNLELADMQALLEAVPKALDGKILTREELADEILRITKRPHLEEGLRSGWGALLKPAAFRGLLCFGPQSGRNVTFVRADQWIKRWKDYETDDALKEVFRRFLSVYGPASREEAARWWGVRPAQARRILELLSDELAEVEVDDDGKKRWMLASDLRSLKAAGLPSGVRLLPSFDQVLVLSAPHREAIVDNAFAGRIYRPRIAVWSLPAVLVDGRVQAAWTLDRKKATAVVHVKPFTKLSRAARSGLADEVERLAPLLEQEVQLEVTR
jgi:Winged helix DNA-binding domain